MALRKDIWRPAIVAAPVDTILAQGSVEGLRVHWLPEAGPFRFLADPFGLWRDGLLHVFVEAYDYRDRIGTIEVLTYDAGFALLDRRRVLAEPWHLSYPQVFEAEGETWMLPEAHRSGRLTLYRAAEFPHRWEAAHTIALDHVAVDATPVRHEGRWWLFYTSAGNEWDKMGALHCAWADRLAGPWTPHPANPIRTDRRSARPGGTAVSAEGRILLPVQDCGRTYGSAIRPMTIDISTQAIALTVGPRLTPPAAFAPYVEGLHTLAAAGPVTLIDVKRTLLTPRGLGIEVRREAGKLLRRGLAQAARRGAGPASDPDAGGASPISAR